MQFMFTTLRLELGDTFYYLLIFVALFLSAKHFAWDPVTRMMEKRRQKVINDPDRVESNRKEAALLANQHEAASGGSKQEITQIPSTAKRSAERTKSNIISQADQGATVIRERASKDAAQAKTDALNEARDQVADTSAAIAEKAISKNSSAADQKDLVDQFTKGLSD